MTTATPPTPALPWDRLGAPYPASLWRRFTHALSTRVLARVRAGTTAGPAAPPGHHAHAGAEGLVVPEPPPGIEELYHHRRLSLVRLAVLLVDDLPTAEDVVQDAFTALFRRHGHRLGALDDPEAYLRTSVVNGARSVLRRRRTVRAHTPEREQHAPAPEEDVLVHEDHREVLAALRTLTPRQREVLVLRYWSHLSEAEIAATLGLSRGAVKSTASRALDALGRRLEGLR
ncbi:RNA polymerase sigma-70 factor (sigma-E family) [Streptomyces griseochromogenes]|uniref:RNA polymerase sigma-70 factor (Sigma-E family) n=1 Tax=Streptomyces griseochromogenes TaxID=68214 RepID=A0A1B1AX53_9ACTN|nr:SigE family RNA polymerase sigma factor [Streptomyces griseochromogenes]ANP51117.1 RNA polymerase subunit sigma-70 [Streptomyces griseochromogenes]MBP2050228.1 RNA polymerase sigma-70 factor (sigma-E family) [Streptomyces griseochromogenes]